MIKIDSFTYDPRPIIAILRRVVDEMCASSCSVKSVMFSSLISACSLSETLVFLGLGLCQCLANIT
jgi:hypothetical protein